MGNSVDRLRPLFVPAVIVVLWLLSGLAYSVTAGSGRVPPAMAALVFPETLPLRAQVFLDVPGRMLVAGLAAAAVAAAALALLPPPARNGTAPRYRVFLAAWMAVALASLIGSAVLGTAMVLANWPVRTTELFSLLASSLFTGAYWGVLCGWLPAMVSMYLPVQVPKQHDGALQEYPRSDAEHRNRAVAAWAVFSAALLVALPFAAHSPAPPAAADAPSVSAAPSVPVEPAPEPTVYGAAPVAAAPVAPDPQWCTGGEVAVSIGGWDAALGHRAATITVQNTGTRTCIVQGYPDLDFESSDGWVMGITTVHGGSHMTQDLSFGPVSLAPGAKAVASIGWRGTAGAGMVRVGTLLVAPYPGTQRQELAADIDLSEPGYLTVTEWGPPLAPDGV